MLIGGAFVCSFLLAPALWFGNRFVPTAPVVEGWHISLFLNYFLVAALLISLLLATLSDSGYAELAAALCFAALFFFDIQRFQQEMILFSSWTLLIGLYKRFIIHEMAILPSIMLTILALYLVGGSMKLNPWFGEDVFKWVVSPVNEWPLGNYFERAWFLGPLSEIALGLLLMFRKTRFLGGLAAALYHLLMLFLFGPIAGNNYHRAMWSMQTILPVVIWAIVGYKEYANPLGYLKTCVSPKVVFVFFFLLPILHVFGSWDAAPSFATYDGRHNLGYIAVEEYVVKQLPQRIRKHTKKVLEHDKYFFPIESLLEKECGVPFYHEKRVYMQYKHWLERYAGHPGDVFVVVFDKDDILFYQ